jgi:hypothetical protein
MPETTNLPVIPPEPVRPVRPKAKNRKGEPPKRDAKGRILPGYSGWPGGDPGRARRDLNADTIRELHRAFRVGGRKAIDKVMKQSPAMFLKMLVLLVPRDIEVTHKGGVKAMSDEQIERAIEAIEDLIARRAGEHAKVVDVTPSVTPEDVTPTDSERDQ